ncbi:MAG: hypothetical protein AAF518_15140 [Spirochaetota bacterium]
MNNNPVIFLMDIIFLVSIASLISWYFYYYLQKDIFGKFLGGAIIAAAGSVLFVIIQTPIRQIIMWFVSPKLGTMQLSRVNIIAAILGAYLSLYIFNRINRNRTRKD